MADSADFNNSAQYVNFNVTNLDRDAFIFHKYNLNLSYDGIRLKWNNTFKELQEFFQNTVGLNGKWISPGGSSKRYIDADFDLIANWYSGKQNSLLFQGKDGSLLREFLINLFTQAAVLNCPDKTQSQLDNIDIESRSPSTSFVEGICDYTNDVDTPKVKKDAISVADVSSIEELEHFIDNSYQNMSVLNTDYYVLKSTPLRLNSNNISSAIEMRVSKIENRIECEMEKLLARISEQDQIIDVNKQEVHRLSSENLHLKSRILNLEEMIISQDKISNEKASVEMSNKNECIIIENECTLIDDHIYNNPGSDITIQAVKPNRAISEVVSQNEENYLNTDSVHINNSLEDSCLTVQSTSVNDTNNIAYEVNVCTEGVTYNINNNCHNNKCKINEVEQIEHNTNNKTNKTKTPGDESNDPQCNLNFHLESLPQLSLGNLPLIETFKPDSNRKKKEISLKERNSTKSQVADQVDEVTNQLSINTSQSINSNLNLNCVKEVKTHKQVHVKSKNVIQDMSGDQVSDLTRQLPRNNLVNASDCDSDHRRYNIPVRITHRPNNGHLSRRSTRRRKYFFRRGAKRHRPPGWPEFLELVKQITTTV